MQVPTFKSWNGFILCIENSRRLFDAARLLADREFYGQAGSLMVLSAEESAKGVGIASLFFSPAEMRPRLKRYFRDHSFKHDFAGAFIALTSLVNGMMDEVLDIEQDSEISNAECTKELLSRMMRRLEHYLSEEDDLFKDVKAWQLEADLVKQRGFYVDFRDGAWRSPADLGVDTYTAMWKKAEYLLRLLELVVERIDPDELRHQMEKHLAGSAKTSLEPTR